MALQQANPNLRRAIQKQLRNTRNFRKPGRVLDFNNHSKLKYDQNSSRIQTIKTTLNHEEGTKI